MPTSGVTHWPGTLREGVPWLLGVAPRTEFTGGVCGKLYFPKLNFSPFRKSGPLPAALTRPPRLNKPCQRHPRPPRCVPHLDETHPPAPPQEGVLPRHIQVCPPTRGPSRGSCPCAQDKTPRAPLPPYSHPQTHLLLALRGVSPHPGGPPTPAGHASFGDASWGWLRRPPPPGVAPPASARHSPPS